MKTIGITGGVGCGKSKILEYIKDNYNCEIVLADDVGNKIKEPGEVCFEPLVELLGKDVVGDDGYIDKKKMAEKIFSDKTLLQGINDIIHPAVRVYLLNRRDEEKQKNKLDYFFIEAALLIECGYKEEVDEMWYIYTREDIRRERLKASRGYSDEKIDSIMASQLSEEEFRQGSDFVIDNSGSLIDTYKQIDNRLGVKRGR